MLTFLNVIQSIFNVVDIIIGIGLFIYVLHLAPFSTIVHVIINSWLSSCSTARGSGNGFFPVGPTKVKACKLVLFTKSYEYTNV